MTVVVEVRVEMNEDIGIPWDDIEPITILVSVDVDYDLAVTKFVSETYNVENVREIRYTLDGSLQGHYITL